MDLADLMDPVGGKGVAAVQSDRQVHTIEMEPRDFLAAMRYFSPAER